MAGMVLLQVFVKFFKGNFISTLKFSVFFGFFLNGIISKMNVPILKIFQTVHMTTGPEIPLFEPVKFVDAVLGSG